MSATCIPFREALSALADGELSPIDESAVRAHVDGCARCAAFAGATEALDRRVRFTEAEPVPDLTAQILAAVPTPDLAREHERFSQLRVLLGLTGVAQLVLAVIVLVTADGLGVHTSREVGMFCRSSSHSTPAAKPASPSSEFDTFSETVGTWWPSASHCFSAASDCRSIDRVSAA